MIIDLSKINFGGGGGSKIKVQDVKVVTQNVDSSGAYDFQPDEGYDAMKAVKANLTIPSTPVQTVDLDTGIKFSTSLFTTLPFRIKGGSGITDFDYMFQSCSKLTAIDLSEIDTSNALGMNYMFYSCVNLTNLDLSSFNTSKVLEMISMFNRCIRLTNLDLSSFNTSHLKSMESMFSSCYALTNLDLSSFNTPNISNMNTMFYDCRNLTTLDISNFDMTDNKKYVSMFGKCKSLTTINVSNCNDNTKNKILTQLQTDLTSYTWTLGDDGIIRRSETT